MVLVAKRASPVRRVPPGLSLYNRVAVLALPAFAAFTYIEHRPLRAEILWGFSSHHTGMFQGIQIVGEKNKAHRQYDMDW